MRRSMELSWASGCTLTSENRRSFSRLEFPAFECDCQKSNGKQEIEQNLGKRLLRGPALLLHRANY